MPGSAALGRFGSLARWANRGRLCGFRVGGWGLALHECAAPWWRMHLLGRGQIWAILQTGYFSVLATRLRPFQIADDGLPPVIHMDVLNADKLLPTTPQASKDLNLGCISPH